MIKEGFAPLKLVELSPDLKQFESFVNLLPGEKNSEELLTVRLFKIMNMQN